MIWKKLLLSLLLLLMTLLVSSLAQEPDTNTAKSASYCFHALQGCLCKDYLFQAITNEDAKFLENLFPTDKYGEPEPMKQLRSPLLKISRFRVTCLKAGTYSLFTIPEKEKWTIIINNELGLWGSYNYNSKLDQMRFDVPVQN